jgi:hypothetical protein
MSEQSRLNKVLSENGKLKSRIKSLELQLERQGDENRMLVRMCNKMSQELGVLKCRGRVGDYTSTHWNEKK